MLSQENNRRLCLVENGAPAGEMFRSMWLPAILSSQLPHSECAPVRLKLLGEELVAYRDGSGKVGILESQCAHRLAPLFFGKVEKRGIRCSYHGWLYDHTGQCLDIPSDPGSTTCHNMRLKAYPTVEKADIVWIYMGTGTPPALPQFPWIDLPASQRMTAVWLQETNWFQGVEGEIDSSHVSILHQSQLLKEIGYNVHQKYTFEDPSPKLFTKDTTIGFMSVARRKAEADYYWRVTQWMAPMYSFIPSAIWPVGGRAWIPIDDENTYTWDFSYQRDADIPQDFRDAVAMGVLFPPQCEYRSHRLNNGSVVDTYLPVRSVRNDYMIDRDQQGSAYSTTGILGVNDQDRAMQEGMGHIVDRTREHLVGADLTVVIARKKILDIVSSAESLEKFRALIADGSAYAVEPIDAVDPSDDLDTFLSTRESVQ